MAQRLDYGGVRCSECGREVDEFMTIAERWLYYSDGRDLLAYCPDCARREFSGDAPERLHRLDLRVTTPVARVLDLHLADSPGL